VSPSELSAVQIGWHLREARLKADLSLADVAKGTGLSLSFLSVVEQGKSDISMSRLVRLIDFLGVALSDLIDSEPGHRYQVVRRDERPMIVHRDIGVVVELLPSLEGFERRLMTFEPGAAINIEDYQMMSPGDSFYLMLKGEICVGLTGTTILTLSSGDSVALRHRHFRRLWNARRYKAEVFIELRPSVRPRPGSQ
jgi:transcriptional regulator with XRE-family HTH domain